jgi:predicted  nucleic acid-binding Zn-ribbon protein
MEDKMIKKLLKEYRDELKELYETKETIEDWLANRHKEYEKVKGNLSLIRVEIKIDNLKKHINLLEVLQEGFKRDKKGKE